MYHRDAGSVGSGEAADHAWHSCHSRAQVPGFERGRVWHCGAVGAQRKRCGRHRKWGENRMKIGQTIRAKWDCSLGVCVDAPCLALPELVSVTAQGQFADAARKPLHLQLSSPGSGVLEQWNRRIMTCDWRCPCGAPVPLQLFSPRPKSPNRKSGQGRAAYQPNKRSDAVQGD